MAEQYWIGDFFIDLSRNQITQHMQSQVIAPKALAVLTHLAENQGKVVSHDALLANVWQDTVVSTNTLQRSIAQLRKALGDDGKVQVYIKTHAKQGYSLECGVRWPDNASSTNTDAIPSSSTQEESIEKTQIKENTVEECSISGAISDTNTVVDNATMTIGKPKAVWANFKLITIALGIMFLGFIGNKYLSPKQSPQFSFEKLRAMTSTDNKELASIYSPDGEYIVFHRYSEKFCTNNVWAKNTETQQEFQLTKDLDSYGSHSFSKDGSKLVFIKSGGCNKPITQEKCYQLMSLDFNKALVSPQIPQVLMECKNSAIRSPKWLDNNNITLLQKASKRWKLINYSVSENKSHDLYVLKSGNIMDYDYSATKDLIALTAIHHDGHYYIEMLNSNGQLISSYQIEYPQEIANFRLIYPNFSPIENQLIFSTGKQLFTLSYDGKITNISLPLDAPMGSPKFHPDGKRMLVIKGYYDSDIVSVPLAQITREQNQQSTIGSVIERSILGEDIAMLQPNGELIAYRSGRSGEDQLWITDNKNSRQLTHFPMDTYVYGMDWAADGKSVLVNANDALTQVFLDAKQITFPLAFPVVQLFQWDSNNNKALVQIRNNGILKFAELNLTNSKIRIINDKKVSWALKSENGQLIYKDHLNRFWQPGAAEDQAIEALDGQGKAKQRFLIKDNVIYGVNEHLQLWSYAINEKSFEIIGKLPSNFDDLTDVSETEILMTIRVSSNKEVVELSLKE